MPKGRKKMRKAVKTPSANASSSPTDTSPICAKKTYSTAMSLRSQRSLDKLSSRSSNQFEQLRRHFVLFGDSSDQDDMPKVTKKTRKAQKTTSANASSSPTASSPICAKKTYSTATTRFLDVLPDLKDCTLDVDESGLNKLPDKILLLNSELPLRLALSIDNDGESYLFRQLASPLENLNAHRYICLLCRHSKQYGTKDEKEIIEHYWVQHELRVEVGSSKFSDEVVFVCLPKQILSSLESNPTSILVNAPCQYCGEQCKLPHIEAMKQHYKNTHNKEVMLIQQEEILEMHMAFYCCSCSHQSTSFDVHHKHMKTAHQLKSYQCKSCTFTTADPNRLRSHFRSKHLNSAANSNLQCRYCPGVLCGMERLVKHVQDSHCVQTDSENYSCIACLQIAGKGNQLWEHSTRCTAIVQNKEKEKKEVIEESVPFTNGSGPACFICREIFASNEKLELHQHHVHMKWTAVRPSGTHSLLTIDKVPSLEEVKKLRIKTDLGHFCRFCDTLIKVYPLYYLHVSNVHQMTKSFQCQISSCRKTFSTTAEFEEHCTTLSHPQKTIVENPHDVLVCTFCDLYFESEEKLQTHLLTDEHINKYTIGSGNQFRNEAHNYKCRSCHTWFGMKDAWINHLESESHSYACPHCGITTPLPSTRRNHIVNYHSDKKNICEWCKQPQKGDMMGHLVTHGVVFECRHCMKTFFQREQLNVHLEVHLEPITCKWEGCAKQLPTRSQLVNHVRQHRSDSKCNICGAKFWNQKMLDQHMKSHANLLQSQNAVQEAVKSITEATSQAITAGTLKNQSPLKQTRTLATTLRISSAKIGGAQQKQTSFKLIKCGHCNAIFTNSKELSQHKCIKQTTGSVKIAAPSNQGSIDLADSEDPQKMLLYLASQIAEEAEKDNEGNKVNNVKSASQQPQQQQFIKLPARIPVGGQQIQAAVKTETTQASKPPPRRRPPAKKASKSAAPQAPGIDLSSLTANVGNTEINASGQAQYWVLNQATNEIIQITAPVGVPIQDLVQQLTNSNGGFITNESSAPAAVTNNVIVKNDSPEPPAPAPELQNETANASGSQEESVIMLPANCFNEDGTLTLDAATLSSLNLAIVSDPGAGGDGSSTETYFVDQTAENQQ